MVIVLYIPPWKQNAPALLFFFFKFLFTLILFFFFKFLFTLIIILIHRSELELENFSFFFSSGPPVDSGATSDVQRAGRGVHGALRVLVI